jgi:hypothetical protein
MCREDTSVQSKLFSEQGCCAGETKGLQKKKPESFMTASFCDQWFERSLPCRHD